MATVAPAMADLDSFAGTEREAKNRLSANSDRQVIVFTLPRSGVQNGDLIAKTFLQVNSIINERQADYSRRALESLVNAFMPTIPLPNSAVREAEMIVKARASVLGSGDWVSAAHLSEMASFSSSSHNVQTNRWKREGKIFSIKSAAGLDLFPVFALDPSKNYRPRPVMAQIITVFRDHKDGWGMAYWLTSLCGFLGGRPPKNVLATDPAAVVAAALDEVQGFAHG